MAERNSNATKSNLLGFPKVSSEPLKLYLSTSTRPKNLGGIFADTMKKNCEFSQVTRICLFPILEETKINNKWSKFFYQEGNNNFTIVIVSTKNLSEMQKLNNGIFQIKSIVIQVCCKEN